MNGFTHSTGWSGQQLTVGILRRLAEAATDSGGQIRIRINHTERQER